MVLVSRERWMWFSHPRRMPGGSGFLLDLVLFFPRWCEPRWCTARWCTAVGVTNHHSCGNTRSTPKIMKPRPLCDGLGFCAIAEATPHTLSGVSTTVGLASSYFWSEFATSTRATGCSTARGATGKSRSAPIVIGASATARPIAGGNSGQWTSEKQ